MAYIGEKNQGGFNEKIVANRTPIIELNGVANLSLLRDEQQTENGGEITDEISEYRVHHNSGGDFARLTSAERGRYVPGNVGEVGIGVRLDSIPVSGDTELKWGYFQMKLDASGNTTTEVEDGVLFGQDTGGTFVEIIKNNVTKHKAYKHKDEWLLNSNVDLDLTWGNIFQITYSYYGYGLIRFQQVVAETGDERQDVVDLHSVRITGETSLDNSNLKVGGFVRSTNSNDDVSMYIAGRQYSTIGPFKPNVRINSEIASKNVGSNTTFTPLVSFKRKSGERETPIQLYGYDIIADDDMEIDIRVDGELTDPSFESVSNQLSGETTVEVDKTASDIDVNTGINILKGLASGGSKNNDRGFSQIESLPLSLPDNSIVTISARYLNASADATTMFKIKEEY